MFIQISLDQQGLNIYIFSNSTRPIYFGNIRLCVYIILAHLHHCTQRAQIPVD